MKKKLSYHYILEIEQYYHTSKFNLEIRDSQIKNAGKGVFTNEEIPNNTFIDYYYGDICHHLKCGDYYFSISNDIGINAQNFPRCFMAMINDNYKSNFDINCEFIIKNNNIVEIWSTKIILKNTELFISYGEDYWK